MGIDKIAEFKLLQREVMECRQESKSLENENRALQQLLEILKDPVVTTFQDRKYTNNVR